MMTKEKQVETAEVRYTVTFQNKQQALARINWLIDSHDEDNPYDACEGCEKCKEIQDIRKSYIGDIFGKLQRKDKKAEARMLTKEKILAIYDGIQEGQEEHKLARSLNVSLNTVEFYKRLWLGNKDALTVFKRHEKYKH